MNFIELTNEQTENLDFDIKDASDLLWQDIAILADWVEPQDEQFFMDLSVQEVLNLYRVSCDFEDFDDYFEQYPDEALEAYNLSVNVSNKMEVE